MPFTSRSTPDGAVWRRRRVRDLHVRCFRHRLGERDAEHLAVDRNDRSWLTARLECSRRERRIDDQIPIELDGEQPFRSRSPWTRRARRQ